MKRVVAWAVRNGPSMNTLMIAIIVVGIGGLAMLRREEFPETALDTIAISVAYPGATPAQVEEGICQKIEEAIRSINGIKKVLSVANEGMGAVTATLHTHVDDPQRVVADVRSAIDQIPSFPEQAEEPDIREVIISLPAMHVAVVGPDDPSEAATWRLRQLSEQIRDEILDLPNVSLIDFLAAPEFQIDVEIPEATLRKHGMTLSDVARAIRRENVELPAGSIRTESLEFLLRGTNRQLVGGEIAKFPVLTQANGVVLTVNDLGRVVDGFGDATMVSYVDGHPCFSLQLDRTSEEDLLRITREVTDYVEQRNESLPEGYQMVIWYDASTEVRDRLHLLYRSGAFGLALVFLTLSLFLNIRLAFWVAAGIPVTVLGTCAVLFMTDQTLNQLSMFAFVMALGIVVDDAIVIGENVYEHRQRGKSRVQAAIDGTIEVAPAITAAVMTTIIAFLPMFFVSGLMGKFIAIMPQVICTLLLFSLFESLLILPCHLGNASFKPLTRFYENLRLSVDRGLERLIQGPYRSTLHWLLLRPAVGFAASIAALLAVAGLVQGGFTPFVLAPQIDGDIVLCNLAYPAGTPLATTDAATQRIEAAAREIADEYSERGQPVVAHVFRSAGAWVAQDPTRPASSGTNYGNLFVKLVPASERPYISSREFVDMWRNRVGEIAGVERVEFENMNVGPGGKPIEFKLLGDDYELLAEGVERTKTKLATYQGVFDITDGDEIGKWEFQLKVTPRAQALGITLDELASTVRAAYYGEEVMRLQRGRHEIKLMVRYPAEERRSLAQFEEIRVRTPGGAEVPITELAERTLGRQSAQVVRIDQQRAVTITANLDENSANAREIVTDLKASFLPGLFEELPGLGVRWEGQQEQTNESVTSLMYGFIVAIFGIYFLLTLQFGSYAQPLLILAVIPFGLVGAVLGHLALDLPLTIFTLFGVVALSGVVVNDSIVLIDFINKHRVAGADLNEALIEAGCRRFRPVLLTSMTTIVGLLPILLERSMQAQLLIPMAAAISFGLAVATFWILLLVPLLYQAYARWLEARPHADDEFQEGPPEHGDDRLTPEAAEVSGNGRDANEPELPAAELQTRHL